MIGQKKILALLAKKKKEAALATVTKEDVSDGEGEDEVKPKGAGCYETDEETEKCQMKKKSLKTYLLMGLNISSIRQMSVVRVDDFSPVGKWDKEEGKIIFDDDSEAAKVNNL